MMHHWRVVAGVAAALTALVLGGCSLLGGSASYRFRMTVEVQTPQGLKSGSSVMEVKVLRGAAIGDQSGISSGLRGEAVVVDLPDGPLFALLQIPDPHGTLLGLVGDALRRRRSSTPDEVITDTKKLGSAWFSANKAELPRKDWPMMVRFGDIHDPKSVEKVDPDAIGVKRIVVETTREPVTTGIEKRLEWLDLMEERQSHSVLETDSSALVGQLRSR